MNDIVNRADMPAFDGIMFEGPMDIAALPHSPGVYLITTEASGGVKILGAYGAEDMCQSAATNPKRACWEKNRKDTDPVAFCRVVADADARDRLSFSIMHGRFYELVCNDPIGDDF